MAKMNWSQRLDRAQDRREKKQREQARKAMAAIAERQAEEARQGKALPSDWKAGK